MKQQLNRVQVNLPTYVYKRLRRIAFERNISLSGYIRKTLEATILSPEVTESTSAYLLKHAGFIQGASDDSVSHDEWAHKTATFHKK